MEASDFAAWIAVPHDSYPRDKMRAYISLIDGTKAALGRRMAQITELTNGWKPAGLKEPSLAGVRPKAFGEDERSAMSDFVASTVGLLGIPGVAAAVVQDGRTVYCTLRLIRVERQSRFMKGHADFSFPVPQLFSLEGNQLKAKVLQRPMELLRTDHRSEGCDGCVNEALIY